MNWDQIAGNWTTFKSYIMQRWEKITDSQLEAIAGKRDHLAGAIQVMYGIDYQEAEYQISDWQAKMIQIDDHFYRPKNVFEKRVFIEKVQ